MTGVSPAVLVINAGSSSLKYRLVGIGDGTVAAQGLIERIGTDSASTRHEVDGQTQTRELTVADHAAAFEVLRQSFAEHGPDLDAHDLVALGHRVVHGGHEVTDPVVIDESVLATIERHIPLAPLHNPANLTGIRAAMDAFADLPQVAVFDTAFHQRMPAAASTYAVPTDWRTQHGVRRYGFHGTSHAYVSRRAAALVGRPYEDVATIVLHLGNGASACAVDGGRSVDTSMGMTPVEGLVMGTRSGDVDPSLAGHLARVAGLDAAAVDRALNTQSGLLALVGDADFRELMQQREAGWAEAQLAFEVVVHRLVRYAGAFAAVLGRLDAMAFTGGIGENVPELRAAVLSRLGILGVGLDADANARADGESLVTAPGSRVPAYVIPTDEEGEIARQSAQALNLA